MPWLDVASARTDITVPPDATPMDYGYFLEVDGLGLLDPRIVVQ